MKMMGTNGGGTQLYWHTIASSFAGLQITPREVLSALRRHDGL
jgi:hypothetical protein